MTQNLVQRRDKKTILLTEVNFRDLITSYKWGSTGRNKLDFD